MQIHTLVVGMMEVNCYIVEQAGACAVIDPGEEPQRLISFLEDNGLTPTHILLTHGHFDHIGGVNPLRERFGCQLAVGKGDAPMLADPQQNMGTMTGKPLDLYRMTPDLLLEEGETVQVGPLAFQVLETPGHCRGALSFLIEVDGLKALCTGDMFFVTPFPPRDQDDVELGYMGSRDFSLTEFQASLGRLQKLEFDLLLPGHYYFYGGAEAGRLIARAYEKARALKGDL